MRAALLALLLAAPLAPAQGDPYEREIDKGRAQFERGAFDEAAGHFARAASMRPGLWRAHAYHAMTLLQQATFEQVPQRRTAVLQEARRIAALLVKHCGIRMTDPLYLFLTGTAYSIDGEDLRAYETLKRALDLPDATCVPYDEISLQSNLERAFAKASVSMAERLIVIGQFSHADELMDAANPYLAETDPARPHFENQYAVVSEHLGRTERAMEHLRKAARLTKDDDRRQMYLATVALILLQNNRIEDGAKVLREELPQDSQHPDVILARCSLLYKEALRKPDGPAMDEALAYYRKTLPGYPEEDAYLLVRQFTEMVLEKVGPAQASKERPLLEETVRLALRQTEVRPECPSMYYALYRLYRLLGDAEKEIRYQDLHEIRKREWNNREQYDARGRPRCR